MNGKLFIKEFEDVKKIFPKLKYGWSDEMKSIYISGQLDICDANGDYWETFDVFLIVGDDYPYSIPVLFERSNKIPRDENRHISEGGICCLDMEHNMLQEAKRGINIYDFIRNRVYPYFANQLYFDKEKKYANGEWKHDFEGVKQFYDSELGMTDPPLIVNFLTQLLSNKLPRRNDACLCGYKKYKNCFHQDSMAFLSGLPQERLLKDLSGFKAIIAK